MPRRFTLTSSPAELVVELSRNPRQFNDFMQLMLDRDFTGQVLLDFNRGRPRMVAFPSMRRVPILKDTKDAAGVSSPPTPPTS